MPYIIYDTEFSALVQPFSQLLQFAGLYCDDDLIEQNATDIKMRLMPHVLPDPEACLVMGVTLDEIQNRITSHYAGSLAVYEWLWRHANPHNPTIFLSYNGLKADEEILRQTFYQTLQPPFITNAAQSFASRGDLMKMMIALNAMRPGLFQFKTRINKHGQTVPSFKLGDVCAANGLLPPDAKLHDALTDVRLTRLLAQRMATLAPDLWREMMENTIKRDTKKFIFDKAQPVFGHVRIQATSASLHWLTAVASLPHADKKAEHHEPMVIAFDVSHNPADYYKKSVAELAAAIDQPPYALQIIRCNQQPMVFTPKTMAEASETLATNLGVAKRRARMIEGNYDFQQKLQQALALKTASWQKPKTNPEAEERLYDFSAPTDAQQADAALMRQMHKQPLNEWPKLIAKLQQDKMQALAWRIVGEHAPQSLPPEHSYDAFVRQRLGADASSRWITKAKFEQRIAELEQNWAQSRWAGDAHAKELLAKMKAEIAAFSLPPQKPTPPSAGTAPTPPQGAPPAAPTL